MEEMQGQIMQYDSRLLIICIIVNLAKTFAH